MSRPLKSCFPGNKGHSFMKQQWFQDFMTDIYNVYVQDYLQRLDLLDPKKAKYLREVFSFMMKHVPAEFRIGNTPFTQLSLVGGWLFQHLGINIHRDKPDILSVLFHCGIVESGGDTVYYSGSFCDDCHPSTVVTFKHGQIHIGDYRTILHGCTPWKGVRYTFNINLKQYVYDFFRNGYFPLYKSWVKAGRPLSKDDCPTDGNGKDNLWIE